jgi:hypothetical protein
MRVTTTQVMKKIFMHSACGDPARGTGCTGGSAAQARADLLSSNFEEFHERDDKNHTMQPAASPRPPCPLQFLPGPAETRTRLQIHHWKPSAMGCLLMQYGALDNMYSTQHHWSSQQTKNKNLPWGKATANQVLGNWRT